MKSGNWIVTMFFLILAFSACKYDKYEPLAKCTTPAVVSFTQHVQPIFNNHCNTSGCHSGTHPAGGLNLEPIVAYGQLLNSSSGYVDTVNPNYSVIIASINSVSSPMPPTGLLDSCTTSVVLKWIQQKAKNN